MKSAKILFLAFMLAIPFTYSAEVGMLTIDDDEIEILVNGQNMIFDNETRGSFQFLLPECDKTQLINCNAERKYKDENFEKIKSEIVVFKNKVSQMEMNDGSNLRVIKDLEKKNTRIDEENKWLKVLLAINIIFMVFVMISAYFYIKKHRN